MTPEDFKWRLRRMDVMGCDDRVICNCRYENNDKTKGMVRIPSGNCPIHGSS